MKTLLPNARFLTLVSENMGQDWFDKSREIDRHLSELSMDLAEESVYLLYDRSPAAVADGEGTCLIARSVIGPKRQLEGRLGQQDWVQSLVYRLPLSSFTHWPQLLEESQQEWENLQRQALVTAPGFMLVFKRRLQEGTWNLLAEVLFRA